MIWSYKRLFRNGNEFFSGTLCLTNSSFPPSSPTLTNFIPLIIFNQERYRDNLSIYKYIYVYIYIYIYIYICMVFFVCLMWCFCSFPWRAIIKNYWSNRKWWISSKLSDLILLKHWSKACYLLIDFIQQEMWIQ